MVLQQVQTEVIQYFQLSHQLVAVEEEQRAVHLVSEVDMMVVQAEALVIMPVHRMVVVLHLQLARLKVVMEGQEVLVPQVTQAAVAVALQVLEAMLQILQQQAVAETVLHQRLQVHQ